MENIGDEHSFWISYTDLITGFLIIFIVITLVLQLNIDKDTKRRTEESNLKGYFKEKVDEEFNNKNIQVLDDGAIRFISGESTGNSESMLFERNHRDPTNAFKTILNDFAFIFFDKVKDYYKSEDFDIREIRIEGHTDSSGEYIRNIRLSNNRALEVYKYILSIPEYSDRYPKEFKDFIKEKITIVGFGPSKILDSNGKYISNSNLQEDNDMSRRVEFRIIIKPN